MLPMGNLMVPARADGSTSCFVASNRRRLSPPVELKKGKLPRVEALFSLHHTSDSRLFLTSSSPPSILLTSLLMLANVLTLLALGSASVQAAPASLGARATT